MASRRWMSTTSKQSQRKAGGNVPFPPDPPSLVYAKPINGRGVWGGWHISPSLVLVFCLFVPAVILAMHLAMLPQGQWHDEFYTFSFLRALGVRGALRRLVNWGPRPFSEALIFAYWHLVRATGRPMMTGVLAASWAMMWSLLLAALRPWRAHGQGARWAMALGLPGLFLMAGPVAELWYWPLGSLAYMPALGAAAYATIVLSGPGMPGLRAWIWLAAALTLGAWSVELGMFLALFLAPLLAVASWRTDRRAAALMLLPLLASLLVVAGLAHGRTAQANEMVDAGTFHSAWPSLRAAWPIFAGGLLGRDEDGGIRVLAVRLLLLAASWAALGRAWPAPVSRVRLCALLAALSGTALLSIAGAFYQFGVLCCERHEAYRQALYLLMVVGSAGLFPRPTAGHKLAPPALLAAAVLLACPMRISDLLVEYRLAGVQQAAEAAMFSSGGDASGDTLEIVLAPAGPLLEGSPIVPGHYAMAGNPPWYVKGPMMYFGKAHMRVTSIR